MRRFSFALAVLGLIATASPALAQMQDPVIASARHFAQQGNHDTAIAMLRNAMTTRPNDAALRTELLTVLSLKEAALRKQLDDLSREIAALRGAVQPSAIAPAGCLGTASVAPVRVGGSIRTPIKVRDVRPVYPAEAKQARIQGVVILEGTIDCDGTVKDVKVLRSIPELDQAALDAVRQWRYQPTLHNGVPIPLVMTMTMTFRLD